MVDKVQVVEAKPTDEGAQPPTPPRRAPGHRNTDVRDTVAEMAARAQEISQEAGSKVAQAMKDVIGAAAGLAGFAVESARDLVQYMVRRGQMTQEEADKLIREAEEAHARRKPPASPRSAAPREESVRAAAPRPASSPRKPARTKSPAARSPKRAARASKPARKSSPPPRSKAAPKGTARKKR